MPGVNPVDAASGSTISSAPVASTHRAIQSAARAPFLSMLSGLSGDGSGAI
jgi:hypothetical protein